MIDIKDEKIKVYKKIDAEEYRIIENMPRGNKGFGSFPCDGLWLVHTQDHCKSTSFFMDLKKYEELPEKYPLAELALRKDDISSAIMKFLKIKDKTLVETGKSSYSISELSEFIIKYLASQEFGGGSKKILVEKKWIKSTGRESERIFVY
jgi:hypothetical protein